MRIRWLTWSLMGLWGLQFLHADTIVKRNGEHIQGQIVGETANDVSIRRKFKSGNIYFVDKISRADIARIERSATTAESPEPTDGVPPSRPATGEPAVAADRIPDKPAFLEEALKKYEKPDYRAAGIDLSRLIISASPAELQSLSSTVQERLQMSLAQIAASAHFNAALEQARGRAVSLQYVTEYEKPELIPMLEDAYEKAVSTPISAAGDDDDEGKADDQVQPRGGAGIRPRDGQGASRERGPRGSQLPGPARDAGGQGARPERNGAENEKEPERGEVGANEAGANEATSRPAMSIRSWLDSPADFNGNRAESVAMEIQIYHARSLLSERMRLDPAVRTDVDLKAELARERAGLDKLLKAVKARAGGALTPREREAQEARIRNQWDPVLRENWRRQNAVMADLQRAIEEQQRQKQPPGAPAPRQPNEKPE